MNTSQLKQSTINEINDYVSVIEEAARKKMPPESISLYAVATLKFLWFVENHIIPEALGEDEARCNPEETPSTVGDYIDRAKKVLKRINQSLPRR